MYKKNTFLLLELLIAISLFSICIIPLIQLPFNAITIEIRKYQQLELQRIAALTFIDIESRLFTNTISLEQIQCKKNNKHQFTPEILTIDLQGLGKKRFKKTCYLWTSRCKTGKNQEKYRLLTLQIQFQALNDPYFFLKKNHTSDMMTLRYQIFITEIAEQDLI